MSAHLEISGAPRNQNGNWRRRSRACSLAARVGITTRSGSSLFTDRVELFIPPKKGSLAALRPIREILFFEPKGRGTECGTGTRLFE